MIAMRMCMPFGSVVIYCLKNEQGTVTSTIGAVSTRNGSL